MVYIFDLKSEAERIGGSSPSAGTMRVWRKWYTCQTQTLAPQGHVSSTLTSRTKYRTGVMEAHLALTREDEDRNLGAVPHGSMAKMVKAADCKSVIARSNRAGTSNMQDDVSRR